MELTDSDNPNVYMSADELLEDEYMNTIVCAEINETTDPPLQKKNWKIPSTVQSLSPVAACWVILMIILALHVYYTSLMSAKLKDTNNVSQQVYATKDDDNLKREIQQLRAENQHLTSTNKRLIAENQTLRAEITKLRAGNQQLQAETQQLRSELQQLRSDTQKLWEEAQISTKNWMASTAEGMTEPPTTYYYYYYYFNNRKKRQTEHCQSSWLHFQSSCYMTGRSLDQKTWEEARDDCRQSYADLVVIGSQEEQDFIYNSSSAGLDAANFWIGLRVEDGGWKWVNGKDLTNNYWLQSPSEEHQCAISMKRTNGWKSVSCDVKNAWICQKKAMSG